MNLMTTLNKDVNKILEYYVKRQSYSELEFIDDQKLSEIKLCEVISHQRSRDGKDKLVIETQLSSTNDSSESSGNRTCSLLIGNNTGDQSSPSLTNSDYFIKELKVSRVGKSKSLDERHMNITTDDHKITLTTDETVYKAVIDHNREGRQLLQEESFVRDSVELPSSYRSLPGHITNSVSVLNDVKGKNYRKTSNKNRTFASIFSLNKKIKNNKLELKDIDNLALQCFHQNQELKAEVQVKMSPLSLNREMPFKSHTIGEPLQSMKKKKKMPDFIRSILFPTSSLPRTLSCSHKMKHGNSQIHTQEANESSIRDNVYKNIHPTRVVQTLTQGTEEKLCDCEERQLDLISKSLELYIDGIITEAIFKELENFDESSFHFKDCQYNTLSAQRRKNSGDSFRQSHLNLYQSCEHCENVDYQLHSEISNHLIPLINKLEDGNEINFNEDHLNYFLAANCYKEFEEGMRQAIGFKCSIRNLAHLHYVTRKVVRHIGDPNVGDNEHIRRVMQYSEEFLANHYYSHIMKHGSVEKFIFQCRKYDID